MIANFSCKIMMCRLTFFHEREKRVTWGKGKTTDVKSIRVFCPQLRITGQEIEEIWAKIDCFPKGLLLTELFFKY